MAKGSSKRPRLPHPIRRSTRILANKYLPYHPPHHSEFITFNELPHEVQMIIFGNLLDETPRRLILDQNLTKPQSSQDSPQLRTLLQINHASRTVALSKYMLLFEGKCPFRPGMHYMYFNPDVDTLCILDWTILRSSSRWASHNDFASIKHAECESKDYMHVLDLFSKLETLKVHWPIEFTHFGRTYPELEVKMKALKEDIEQWRDEWGPEGCRPEVEVILSEERLASYSRKIPVSVVSSDP